MFILVFTNCKLHNRHHILLFDECNSVTKYSYKIAHFSRCTFTPQFFSLKKSLQSFCFQIILEVEGHIQKFRTTDYPTEASSLKWYFVSKIILVIEKIQEKTGNKNATSHIIQAISMTVQRGNATSIMGTLGPLRNLEDFFYVISPREEEL